MTKLNMEQLKNNVFNGYPISVEVTIKGCGRINREQLREYLKNGQVFVLDNNYAIADTNISSFVSMDGETETAKIKMVSMIK